MSSRRSKNADQQAHHNWLRDEMDDEITDADVKAMTDNKPKRGFASLSPDQRKFIARKGGIAAHKKGTAHQWNKEEATEAGRLAHAQGKAHQWTPEEARIAGRKGGRPRGT